MSSVKIETVGVVVRLPGLKQPRALEGYEIATSAWGLLAMTTPNGQLLQIIFAFWGKEPRVEPGANWLDG